MADSYLDQQLRKAIEERKVSGKCVICNKVITKEDPGVEIDNSFYGKVRVHEKHIKVAVSAEVKPAEPTENKP